MTERPPSEGDFTTARASRMYDYLSGGTDNFDVDRQTVEQMAEHLGGLDRVRCYVRANQAFLARAVRYLASEAGIRQFVDMGTGIPDTDNVHTVVHEVAPGSRILYVSYDPIVREYAHRLLKGTSQRSATFLVADLREADRIVQRAQATLDFGKPVALVMSGPLHLTSDSDDPYGMVSRLLDALPRGSHLAVAHLASDIRPGEMADAVGRLNREAAEVFTLRDRAQVARFFDGLELIAPGVVPVDQWRPDTDGSRRPCGHPVPIYGGLGRK